MAEGSGAAAALTGRQHQLTRPQSAGSLRKSRPSSAAYARTVVPVAHAQRSASIWTDPKMTTLKGFVQKIEDKNLLDAQDDEVDRKDDLDDLDGEDPDLESEVVQPVASIAGSRRNSSSSVMGHSQPNSPVPAAGARAGAAAPAAPQKKNKASRRPASASGACRGHRRPQRAGPQAQRQRSSGCDGIDRKMRSLAKESTAQQQRLAKSKHFGSTGDLGSAVSSLSNSRFASSTSSLPRPMSAPSTRTAKEELAAAEVLRQRAECFESSGPQQRLHEQADRLLRRLFVDIDLAREGGGPEKYSHKARCDHVDKVYEWYERHALLGQASGQKSNGPQTGNSSPWLFVSGDDPPPPGSLRIPKSKYPSPLLSLQQPGSTQRPPQANAAAMGKSTSTPALGAAG